MCLDKPLVSKLPDGFCRAYEADSEKQVFQSRSIFSAYSNARRHLNMQEYRSGHNEAVLKTVRPKATGVRIPLPAPRKGYLFGYPFCVAQEECSHIFSKLCFEWGSQVRRKVSGSSLTKAERCAFCSAKCIPVEHLFFLSTPSVNSFGTPNKMENLTIMRIIIY